MQIRRLNPADDARDLAAVLPAAQAWQKEFLPGFPEFGEARLRLWSSDGYRQQTTVFGVFADEQAVEAEGVALLDLDLAKNLDLAQLLLWASTEARGRGVETALFDEARRITAEQGRKRLAVGMPETEDPAAFAERQGGGKYTDTAIGSALELGAIGRARYEAWAAPSAKNAEYTLVRWIDRCPDELAESYCAALDAMADQPLGTWEYEFAKNDLDRLRFNEEHSQRFGLRRYVQAAVDPDGNVAGLHMLVAHPDEPTDIDVWDTGVARAHRGHGLGLRLKAAASLWALEDRPATRRMFTFNNNENTWMLAVNRTMGYQPVVDFHGYEFAVG
jgi:GNAT superfamily N-acetyltransferase